MNFNHFDKSYYPQEFASPGESNLLQIFNHQAQKIKELEEKIESRDQDLTTLLTQINLQGPSTSQSNPSIKTKGKQPQTPRSSLANNQTRPPARISNIPSKIPLQVSKEAPKQTSTPPKKRNPNQLLLSEVPESFIPTKKAFYEHIKILWGLIYERSVPISPDYSMLKEFNCRFSFLSEIVAHSENTTLPLLVPMKEILTMKSFKPERRILEPTFST
ncbi:hypothetical protein O181_050261 [Austropuccinia psidii MF-1]|uniref:Uncharacterized protein n=1 Tax=Austropuccinia psidii MF-1 TaxID=1389203 RepID=A0A9Q3E1H1_9BASI|nr:hypothetical protein [Austropuccinia psidii MF-1]